MCMYGLYLPSILDWWSFTDWHHYLLADAALAAINSAVDSDSAEHTLQFLHNENLDLSDVDPANAEYYHQGLQEAKRRKPNGRLTEEEVQDCIREMNANADVDTLSELKTPYTLTGLAFMPLEGPF